MTFPLAGSITSKRELAVLSGEGAVDEMPELPRTLGQPVPDYAVILGRRTVAHVFENLWNDVHRISAPGIRFKPWRGGWPPSSGR